MEAFPSLLGESKQLTGIAGNPPSLVTPGGCLFAPRCAYANDECRSVRPELIAYGTTKCVATWSLERGRTMPDAILRVQDLTRLFRVGGFRTRGQLHAIDEVSFEVASGEIVALVGESGSGKSTIARVLAGLYPATSGSFVFEGKAMGRREVRASRGDMPMVFQDPFGSINPVLRVGHALLRSLKLHRPDIKRADRFAEAVALVEKVGLTPGEEVLRRYPHELSGGQRQRLGFAQALASRPSLISPTSRSPCSTSRFASVC